MATGNSGPAGGTAPDGRQEKPAGHAVSVIDAGAPYDATLLFLFEPTAQCRFKTPFQPTPSPAGRK